MKYRSTLFDEARNKIGSAVASKNRNGNYFRNLVIPTNPKTARQSYIRANFTGHSQAWRALTETQRAGWTALSAQVMLTDQLGNKYHPTGQQLYVGCNTNLSYTLGTSEPDAPATPDPIPTITDVEVVATVLAAAPHTQALSVTITAPVGIDFVMVKATALFSAGRSFVGPSQYRVLQAFEVTSGTPINILPDWAAQFGSLAVGSKLSVQVYPITEHGFAGQPQRVDVVVAAA